MGLVGTVLGLFDGLDWWELEWSILLFAGLTVLGVGMVVEDAPRLLGFLVLVSGTSWVGFLAHRPCLLWRSGAYATGPRRVRCLVLPELGSVGRVYFSVGSHNVQNFPRIPYLQAVR